MTTRPAPSPALARRTRWLLRLGLVGAFAGLFSFALAAGHPYTNTAIRPIVLTAGPTTTTTTPTTTTTAPAPSAATPALAPPACTAGSTITLVYGNGAVPSQSILQGSTAPAAYTCATSPQDIVKLNNLLPINRWHSAAVPLTTGAGFSLNPSADASAASNIALNTVATVLFEIAAFVWSLIYDVLQFALTHDLTIGAGLTVNQAFSAISSGISSSALIVALIVATIAMVGINTLRSRGGRQGTLSAILTLIIPLAVLQSLTATAGLASASNPQPSGSPAWLMTQGVSLADDLSNGFAQTVAQAAPQIQDPNANPSAAPSCSAYVQVLYGDYTAGVSAASANGNAQGTTTLEAISSLWQIGYLDNWMTAEFSDYTQAQSLYCHYLEGVATPQAEQQVLNTQAYGAASSPGLGQSGAGQLPTLYIDYSNINPNQNAVLYGWAACSYQSGQWTMNPSWVAVGAGDSSWGWGSNTAKANQQCADWARIGQYNNRTGWPPSSGYNALTWHTLTSLDNDYSNSPNQAQAQAAYNTATAYNGSNTAPRILDGLIAVVTAGAYGWALLGLGLGAVIAQLGLIAMMVLLPGTLVMLALPRSASGGRNLGSKLLRLTGGFFATRLVVMIVLTTLVYLTLVLTNLIAAAHL